MADTIPPVLIELQLETAKIAAQMQQLTGEFSNFGKSVEKQSGFLSQFKSTASGVFAGNLMVTGLNAIKGAIGGAIADAQQYEVLLNQTKAVIESTGNAAGISVASLKEHANQLENISAVDENLILHGENVIATFTNIRNVAGAGNDVFDQTTKAALDLSAALGQDMQSSSIQLGKALNDPIKGLTALQRVGVTFSAEQKKMIATMQNAGDTLGAQKIILAEVNREFGGAAKAAGDTFAGAVFRAKDKVADFGRDLVTNLQPILLNIGKILGDIYDKTLKPLFTWISKNKEAVALFVGILGTAYALLKAYQVIMAVVTTVTELYTVAIALMAGAQLEDVVATEAQTGAMTLLNAVLNANPIGLVVLALAALAAGFVYAWNHSETFRKVVIKVADGVLTYISFMVKAWGEMIQIILKVVTGPMKLFLGVLSHLPGVGSAAKAGLKLINEGIDDVGKFANAAAAKIDGFKAKVDKMGNTKISIPGFGGGSKSDTGGKTPPPGKKADAGKSAAEMKAAAAKAKANAKAIETASKEVTKIYDKMNTAIAEGNKKAADALDKRDQAIIDTKAKYAAKELEITKKKDDELKKNLDAWNDAYATAHKEATKRNAKIDADYTQKKIELHKAADKKIEEAEAAAADKRASIIQASIDRLRSAFASGTAASISDIFKNGATSADAMIQQLKDKLLAAKDLQKNAAALQAAGYSQVFIEEVVKNGPEVGNQMAKALLSADAGTQQQLKDLYGEVNKVSEHGLDAVAKTMNSGGQLATEELMNQFSQVSVDLAKTLAGINSDLTDNLAAANDDYLSKLADSKAMLDEALTKADDALAAANEQTMKDFKEALDKNSADLADALASIQSDYEDTIKKIAEDTKAKLDALQKDLEATIAKLKELGAEAAAAAAAANAPSVTWVPPTVNPPADNPPAGGTGLTNKYGADKAGGVVVNQTIHTTATDPTAITNSTIAAINLGMPSLISGFGSVRGN